MGSKAEQVLARIAKTRGYSADEINVLRDYSDAVGYKESKNNPEAIQQSNNISGIGPGRGTHQVEKAGGSGENTSIVTRYKEFKRKNPDFNDPLTELDWNVLNDPDPDFAFLSADVQTALFYVSQNEGSLPLDDLTSGSLNFKDAWLDHHWKGPAADRERRGGQWTTEFDYREQTDGRRWGEAQPDSAPYQIPDEQTLAGVRKETQASQPPPQEGAPDNGEERQS